MLICILHPAKACEPFITLTENQSADRLRILVEICRFPVRPCGFGLSYGPWQGYGVWSYGLCDDLEIGSDSPQKRHNQDQSKVKLFTVNSE